jgi:hypothetical protein
LTDEAALEYIRMIRIFVDELAKTDDDIAERE